MSGGPYAEGGPGRRVETAWWRAQQVHDGLLGGATFESRDGHWDVELVRTSPCVWQYVISRDGKQVGACVSIADVAPTLRGLGGPELAELVEVAKP